MNHFPPPGHRPGRKAHRILRHLATGTRASFTELMDAAGVNPLTAEGRKFHYPVGAMCRDGLICCGRPGNSYRITVQGQLALARLEAGETVLATDSVAPSVRRFNKEEANA